MKEVRDSDRDSQQGGLHISTERLLQERSHLQQRVTSSVSTSPYDHLPLIGSPGMEVFGAHPSLYSAHLIASLAAASSTGRIPIAIPIPMGIPASAHHPLYRGCGSGPGVVTGHSGNLLPNAQLGILSSWVKEQSSKQEQKISDNKVSSNKNKDVNSKWSVKKNNKKNKQPPVQHGKISSENDGDITKNIMEKEQKEHIKSLNSNSKTVKVTSTKKKEKSVSPANNNNNDNNTNIQQQSNQQSRDKIFICPICNRCFGYKHVLQNHERTHTGEKPFECSICQKKFTRDHHLKTHMRLHTGEKPYQCSHCERQFVQVANLRRHLRVHTGERPYACELCSNRFSDSNQLKAHMLIHKGEKPYGCEECGGRFRRRHHLVHHKCSGQEKNGAPAFSHSRPEILPPTNMHKRKSAHTRRIVRLPPGLPVTLNSGLLPEQTHPEDLSLGGNAIKSRHYSGSHSSCSISPSGGSNGSLGQYCHSTTSSEEPLIYYSDDDVKVKREADISGVVGLNETLSSM